MTRKTRQLWQFHGGLRLADKKAMSTGKPIGPARLPAEVVIPLHQHIGSIGDLLVSVGDRVLKGQPLTLPKAYVSASVHASTSGIVKAIADHPIPHPSGLSSLCVTIESDGKDEWIELDPVADYRELSPGEIRNRVRHAGIVGLGGAAFPTAVKLNPGPDHKIETLILNGSECEPYITCDDMLMRERAIDVIHGAEIIAYAVHAEKCLLAVEDNKPEAIAALEQALETSDCHRIEIVEIPSVYPAGGEKQLIKILTGKEVPSDGLPADIGLLVQNVSTAAAVYRAIVRGEPLVSRVITITGPGVEKPQNLEVLIGTPMADLIAQCGGYKPDAENLIMGGPMMGFSLHSDQLHIIKGCNCLLVKTSADSAIARQTMPCIRCGECTKVCPANLLPQQLYWHASSKNFDVVQDYHLFDCIECGCCAYVCPSQIPLVQYYRFAKTEIWNQEREKQKSDHARIRHEFHQERLEREKREREEALRKKKEMLAKKQAAEAAKASETEDPKKAAIAAAMERVKAKKAFSDSQPKNTDNLTPAQQQQIDQVEQRRHPNKD
ncbi:MAG: electron transport complex subunit RsxC [Gammaproteobacteria bacterium]|nr:MAG: electron transport complex subunit RsxC [Gammaproteobacteria bacterium]